MSSAAIRKSTDFLSENLESEELVLLLRQHLNPYCNAMLKEIFSSIDDSYSKSDFHISKFNTKPRTLYDRHMNQLIQNAQKDVFEAKRKSAIEIGYKCYELEQKYAIKTHLQDDDKLYGECNENSEYC
jgi:hypothetical protein